MNINKISMVRDAANQKILAAVEYEKNNRIIETKHSMRYTRTEYEPNKAIRHLRGFTEMFQCLVAEIIEEDHKGNDK